MSLYPQRRRESMWRAIMPALWTLWYVGMFIYALWLGINDEDWAKATFFLVLAIYGVETNRKRATNA